MEDGSIKTGDKIYEEHLKKVFRETTRQMQSPIEEKDPAHLQIFEAEKLKEPHGAHNYQRIGNVSMGDLLVHIQQPLTAKNMCIIDMITGHPMKCIHHNETIDRVVKNIVSKDITPELKKMYPKVKFENGTEESEDDYICRLCHIIMHHNQPRKLQMIKCTECIHQWLISSKW